MEPEIVAVPEITPLGVELGKALCDRIGLNHDTTLKQWKVEYAGSSVMVSFTTSVVMPLEDFKELQAVAQQRVDQQT